MNPNIIPILLLKIPCYIMTSLLHTYVRGDQKVATIFKMLSKETKHKGELLYSPNF